MRSLGTGRQGGGTPPLPCWPGCPVVSRAAEGRRCGLWARPCRAGVWLPSALGSAQVRQAGRAGAGPRAGCWLFPECSGVQAMTMLHWERLPKPSCLVAAQPGFPHPGTRGGRRGPALLHSPPGRRPAEWEGGRREGSPCFQVLGPPPPGLGCSLCRSWAPALPGRTVAKPGGGECFPLGWSSGGRYRVPAQGCKCCKDPRTSGEAWGGGHFPELFRASAGVFLRKRKLGSQEENPTRAAGHWLGSA